MAEALGLTVVLGVPRLVGARYVRDCGVLLVPEGRTDSEIDEDITWALERLTLAPQT